MQYKTTYFRISLNHSFSISSSNIHAHEDLRLRDRLENDVNSWDKEYSSKYNFSIRNMDIEKLEDSYSILISRYGDKFPGVEILSQHIKYKKIFINKKFPARYTQEHEEELNIHLNSIAQDGWKLHSMQPINKGYISSSDGGHDILEGFVIIWEKE